MFQVSRMNSFHWCRFLLVQRVLDKHKKSCSNICHQIFVTPLSRNDEAILKVFSASWQWFSISGLDFWSWSYSIYVKTMFNFFSQPQESYIVRKAEIVNWYNFAKTSKKWSTFFLKLMHIQYGGRYQHVLTYSGHNNALRITYQRANLLWHFFDGKTPW